MKKKLLLRTNLLLCAVLITGFVSAAIISYQSNIETFRKDIERIANLTSESIYHQIDSYFAEPVSVSKMMANNSLIKRFLAEEPEKTDDEYVSQIQAYLNFYKEQYGYASAFLVSARTERYYHFSGRYRTLTRGGPENAWYYNFFNGTEEYSFDAGKDKYEGEMYFVDCKIYDGGLVTGVIGIGFHIDNLRELLKRYTEEYDIGVLIIDSDDNSGTNEEIAVLFRDCKYLNESILESVITETGSGQTTFWGNRQQQDYFVAARYVPALKCYLIVENNTSKLQVQFERQLIIGVVITVCIALFILALFNKVILSYNERLLKLVVSQELEYHTLLIGAIKELYSNVYEFDVTRGVPTGEETQRYFESMGIHKDAPFADAMNTVTEIQIREEFREGFFAIFSQASVLAAFDKGIRELNYDCMVNTSGKTDKWMRMRARLFYYNSDNSVHMIVFSQDISDEKERERRLLCMAETDPPTGFYNKTAVKERISAALAEAEKSVTCAFIIADIDYFKQVNDTLGHAVGDQVIKDFAARLKRQFRDIDICGRIGGDEFIVFLRDIPGKDWLADKMEKLSADLRWDISDNRRQAEGGINSCAVSASIGAACYPEAGEDFDTLYQNADAALYRVKENGRNGFAIYRSGAV